MPLPNEGFMASRFAMTPPYEDVFKSFKAHAKQFPDESALGVAVRVADTLGISVHTVVDSCALCHAVNAARGQFEKNE